MINSPYLVKPGTKVDLTRLATDGTGDFAAKEEVQAAAAKNLERLQELQDVLYAQAGHALLVVLQAMDAAGKDGVIRHVFSGINPQGCSVTSFKVPSTLELAHDYLWRIHNAVPAKGMIGIFNRSHYESVLVERVKNLVPKRVWSRRFDHINAFEKMLSDEGITIIKFFLHVSKKQQKRRLEERLKDPRKNWKFNPQDLAERDRWKQYMRAYEDVLQNCSMAHAPWYVVPADHKWFRNWVVSDTIVRTLRTLDLRYPPPVKGIERYKVD
jgi:PPK2 family polyphosphate:nucleotide phosphotransferase